MINLTKIVLINWMYFQKATLPISGNAAIVGINGSGKSTIIDAIQMLLLGNKASKFNANANAEKRNLESYVRGATRTDQKEYLRPGDVVCYLALEIELNDVKHIFGINIDYKFNLSKLNDPKYFYIKNLELNENLFIKDDYPKTYDIFVKEMKSNYEFNTFPTLYQYQIKLKDILGLKDEKKYFQTLSRAVGIKNITNCNDFMNEFVLDESPIDVDSIKKNIIEIEKVNSTIEIEEKKLDSLSKIVSLGNKIIDDNKKLDLLKVKINLSLIMQNEYEINKLKDDINSNESLKEFELEKKNNLNEDYNSLLNNKVELKNALDKISPDLAIKRRELELIEKEYDKNHIDLNTFVTKCQNELKNISLLSKYKNKIFNDFYTYLMNAKYETNITRKLFKDFKNELSNIRDIIKNNFYNTENSINEIRNNISEINNIITNLENNKLTFNPKLEEFKNYLKKTLEDKHNEEIEVKYLCEYLDITDKSWQNAIEGYLNTQRFYIIVPNKYYKEAMKIYHEKKDFYQTRIINGTKIPDIEYVDEVLGSFIESSNQTALNYARYILNRVHCVNSIYELDNYDISVTKDCMHYQNYSLGRLNPKACSEQYIGQNGIKSQLIERKKQLAQLIDEANELKNQFYIYKEQLSIIDNEIEFSSSILEDNSLINSINNDSILFDKMESLRNDIKFYESNPQYIEISSKISNIENELININKLIKTHDDNISEYLAIIKKNQELISNKENNIELFNDELSGFDRSLIDLGNNELLDIKISPKFINELKSLERPLENSINKNTLDLEYQMREARDEFSLNYEPNMESLVQFKEERNKIDQSVFKYKSKLLDFKNKNKKLFFTQFISKLYNSIEKAKIEIDNLNHSLSTFNFGNDYYKIKMTITDNLDFKLIYDYAKEYNSSNSDTGLFIDREKEDIKRNKIQDILNQYMFSNDLTISNMIVDYRNYLKFDVEVNTPTGIKKLNEVMKSQSGGEVQVPFYILSGVAFQQTLDFKRNKDALGIVLYDEAFDKMDSQRIQAMLEFYRDKLNLQLILATPGKLDSLIDNIETILAVIRDGETAIVSDISHEI